MNLDEKQREKMKINITSPCTCLMKKRNGKWIQGLNLQLICNRNQVVIVNRAFSLSNDLELLGIMYSELSTFLKQEIIKSYLLCDSGYWVPRILENYDPADGYKIIIPSSSSVAKSRKKLPNGRNKGGWIISDGFKRNTELDIITCPENKLLKPVKSLQKRKARNGEVLLSKLYTSKKTDCDLCSKRAQCLGQTKGKVKRFTFAVDTNTISNLKEYCNRPDN